MTRQDLGQGFELEALEPRVLLSASHCAALAPAAPRDLEAAHMVPIAAHEASDSIEFQPEASLEQMLSAPTPAANDAANSQSAQPTPSKAASNDLAQQQ